MPAVGCQPERLDGLGRAGEQRVGPAGPGPPRRDRPPQQADTALLYDVQITVLTAFPGTPLLDRLRREGRLIEDGAWQKCTLFDVNHVPALISPGRLRRGLVDLARRLYDGAFTDARRRRFHQDLVRAGRAVRADH